MCVLPLACVDASVCFHEGKSNVWMVCRPCAGLWGVDCGVLNRSLLMLCLGIWLRCVPLCLHSFTLSLCLSPFFSVFSFIHSFRLSSLSPFCFFLTKFFGYTSEFLSAVVYSCGFHFCPETCPQQCCQMNSFTP